MTKKIIYFLMFSLVLSVIVVPGVLANDQYREFIDPEIPESWYEAPKKASDLDITEFDQSPILEERVESGELPPVEERLPEDPPVIEPYEDVGKYGGTINVWKTTLNRGNDAEFAGNMPTTAGQPAPDGGEMIPYFLEDWEYSDDATELTLHLREGVKFSDGTPLTADDYLYWWEHEANNEEWSSVPPEEWKPVALLDVEKIDDYTVKYVYDKPNPRIHDFEFQNNMGPGIWGEVVPAEFMKDFHPEFIGEESVVEMAEDVDLERWDEYYGRVRDDSPDHPEYEVQRPTISPYVAVERSETNLVLERNPYYPFVDTEGNQLPYVDRINIQLANDEEMAATKSATGEATYSGRNLLTRDIPLYKSNEEKEDYRTLIYTRPYGSDVAIQLNMTHKDDELRELFQNVKFRQALSLAINRENISNKVYFGEAKPRQTAVPPMNEFYEEEHAQAYAEYNPDKAAELLDEIGVKDTDGDGYRELPSGEKFNPTILYCKMGPVDPTSTLELVDNNFDDIGLDFSLKMVSRELHDNRWSSNDADITVWTADLMVDLTFGSQHLGKYFAPIGQLPFNPWPAWVSWYETNGEEGMEPPAEIKQLIEWGENLGYSADAEVRKEAGEELVKAQAENLWTIGTVGMAPQPVIVSNDLKNVPEKGIWGWSVRYMKPMYPVQFYLDE